MNSRKCFPAKGRFLKDVAFSNTFVIFTIKILQEDDKFYFYKYLVIIVLCYFLYACYDYSLRLYNIKKYS